MTDVERRMSEAVALDVMGYFPSVTESVAPTGPCGINRRRRRFAKTSL
jgi:hypothetical protein